MALIHRRVVVVALALFCAVSAPAWAQRRQVAADNASRLPEVAEPQGLIAEPNAIKRVAIFADRHFSSGELREGFYPDIRNMVAGAGWLAGGPGYRRWYEKDRALFDASAGVSWHGFKTAQARFELLKLARSRLAVGSQIRWQDLTQVAFFGEGQGTLESNHSQYRLRSTNVVGYATLRPIQWMGIGGKIGWLTPSILPPAGTFMSDHPDTRRMFPNDVVFAFSDQPAFLHTEASMTADTRDFPGHPLRGSMLRAAASHYSDRDSGVFSFRRYEAEAAHFLPLAESRVVLALHGWLVASDTDQEKFVPFYLQPSIGGHNSLRGYADYRFHDDHLLLVNVEARVALLTHLDAAFLFDAGNVAARVGDLNLDRRSYGAGLRLHTRRQTFGRIDAARSAEGWRVMLSLSDPLNLVRVYRRTAAAPFVP